MGKGILVGIATLNEVENIGEILEKIFSLNYVSDVLIVDGNSNDGTLELIQKLQVTRKNLHLIKQKEKMGLASAHICIFKFALDQDFSHLITLDADTSHDPLEIPKFLNALSNFPESSLIIGSRYMRGGRTDNKGFRLLISLVANKVASLVIGGQIHEYTTSFRLYNVEKLGLIDSGTLDSKGYSFFFRIMYELIKMKNQVVEVPIHFHERFKGKSKIPKTEVFKSLYELSLLRFKDRKIGKALNAKLPKCELCNSIFTVGLSKKSQHVKLVGNKINSLGYVVFCTVCGSIFE